MDSSSSSPGAVAMSLVTGQTSPQPDVMASLRIGDNSGDVSGLYEYLLADGEIASARMIKYGHLTWDPSHREAGSRFFSVVPVRLDVSPGEIRWAVGTNDYLICEPRPFRRIVKVEVAAKAENTSLNRVIQWDLLDVTIHSADGRRHLQSSPCLPKVLTGLPTRRSSQASPAEASQVLQQFVEILPTALDVTRVQILGQVTLRANDSNPQPTPLGADELEARILVFTGAE